MNRLFGTRTYLIGAMDRAEDGGVIWRQDIRQSLNQLGIMVLDPTNKPIDIGTEDEKNRIRRQFLKKHGMYNELRPMTRLIRSVDLRMVDISDFVIVYIDLDVHMCGSYEEISWANRQKKPVLIFCKQGKNMIPDWLFMMLPHEMMFNTSEELVLYLNKVSSGEDDRHFNRWMFFDYKGLLEQIN